MNPLVLKVWEIVLDGPEATLTFCWLTVEWLGGLTDIKLANLTISFADLASLFNLSFPSSPPT